jgi:acyl carrier protein
VTKDDVLDQVRRVIADQFTIPPDSVTRDTVALDVNGWDSVTHVYLMLEIERRFGRKIPDDRVFAMDNVGDLVDILAELPTKPG